MGCWKDVIFKDKVSRVDNWKRLIDLLYVFFQTTAYISFELIRLKPHRQLDKNRDYCSDFVLISHLVENKQNLNDFYFGNLQEDLTQSGKNVFRLLIPHSNSIKDFMPSNDQKTLILREGLSKIKIIEFIFANLVSCTKLVFFLINNKFNFCESIIILTGQIKSFSLFRLTILIKSALVTLTPAKVIFTFEGNSIEKAVFYLCNQMGIESYGYQHAPIIESQYSIFRVLPKNLSPDTILCSGKYTKQKFQYFLGSRRPIRILGSPKFMNYQDINSSSIPKDKILLIPDGNLQSIHTLLELGIYLAHLDSSRKILIRSHPLFKEYLKMKIRINEQISQLNIHLSEADISHDLIASKWLIYQNSSVCIQGLFTGCKLIHFVHPLSNIDPLWEFPDTNSVAKSFSDVSRLMASRRSISIEERVNHFSAGQLYFAQFNPSLLHN